MKICRLLLPALLLLSALTARAQLAVSERRPDGPCFAVATKGQQTRILTDPADHEVVKKVAALFAQDIGRVTGTDGCVLSAAPVNTAAPLIVAGTVGQSRFIDALVEEGKLDVSAIRGGWERYLVQTVDKPFRGVDRALVIAGSDRRGTAYGLFTLSEAMGVSPFYWWADVPVARKKSVYLLTDSYVSKAPSVQYRGIFINDEGWGITPWASKTFDPQLGDIGPKTYARVCELLLRLKGNMLAPAMHPSSGAFNKYPENKLVADSFAIIMTSSHCEPLLFNNVTEWHKDVNGEWNYITNRQGILDVLDKRVASNAPYENIYTIAMRGIHDSGLVGVPKEREVSLVEEVIADQRNILGKHIDAPIDSIPQIFVPYKEVLDIYERGLRLPDDITLVWPDDNYGYIKKLNTPAEAARRGGSGVYYHISYLGGPHDYLWLNTTPPALMYEELSKAYATGARRYWLLNVGDIKPGELGIKTFLDMAWDMDAFDYDNIVRHQPDFLAAIYGDKWHDDLADILSSYYRLGFQRKPEAMGWGYEWNTENAQERMTDTDFSFTNYREAERRMEEYDRIAAKAGRIWRSLPGELKPSFYQLVLYPVKGACLMNKKMLTAQQNRWYARQGRSLTNATADRARSYHDSIGHYTRLYNEQLDGKWRHMMALAPGWVATYQNMPPTTTIDLPEEGRLGIQLPGQDLNHGGTNTLPVLNSLTRRDTYIDLYNTGRKPLEWTAEVSEPWMAVGKRRGKLGGEERLRVWVDWDKLPAADRLTGILTLRCGTDVRPVLLTVMNPASPRPEELKGLYLEENGCVSIDPARYHRKHDTEQVKIHTIPGLGYEGGSVQLGDPLAPSQGTYVIGRTARAEYDFYSFNAGSVSVWIYAVPTFPLHGGTGTSFGVMIDDGLLKLASNTAKEYSGEWNENVARNTTLNMLRLTVDKPGRHTLKLVCKDPGVIIQKVVIDFGGLKRSYLGPEVVRMEE